MTNSQICNKQFEVESKTEHRDGVAVGIVKGYLAAWSPDTGGRFGVPDRFLPGAFRESIKEHKQRDNRPIRLKDQHERTIGGFPIGLVREDDIGLWVEGEINLEIEQGKEAFSLVRQGVLRDFSIGFIPLEDNFEAGIREISKAVIVEGSLVDEPANQDAQITEIKLSLEEVKSLSPRELEKILLASGNFSKTSAKYLVSRLKASSSNSSDQLEKVLADLRAAKDVL